MSWSREEKFANENFSLRQEVGKRRLFGMSICTFLILNHHKRHQLVYPADSQTTVIFAMMSCVVRFTFLRNRRPKHISMQRRENFLYEHWNVFPLCLQFCCSQCFVSLRIRSLKLRFVELYS